MRIVQLTDLLLFSIGGVSNSLLNLSQNLARRRHFVTIFSPKSSRTNRRNLNGVKLDYYPSVSTFWNPRLRAGFTFSPKLFAKIIKINPDIIHFHTPFLIGASAIILGKYLKKPIIGTFHTYFMQPDYLRAAGIKVKSDSVTNFLWKYAVSFYNQCDAIITPTENVRNDLKKYGVKKPIHVISNTIDESQIKFVSKSEIKSLKKKLTLAEKVILFVGRFSYEKNINILLRSFAKVVKKVDNISLLLIGDGQIKSELKSLVKNLKIEKKVVFAGAIGQKLLLTKGYFQSADIFVSASGSETQGISLIEAMYFGLPLIGVSEKGSLDMIRNVGLISKPNNASDLADKMMDVLSKKVLHKKLSRNSRQAYLRHHSTKKIVEQIEKLYVNLSKKQ